MTTEQVLEIIKDYKLRISPVVYYDLLADIWNFEELVTDDNSADTYMKKSDAIRIIQDMHGSASADVVSAAVNKIIELPSASLQKLILDRIRTEMHATAEMHADGDYYLRDEWIAEIIAMYKSNRSKEDADSN